MEEESPSGIGMLFAQFAFAGANNKKVDRYILIEDIKTALKEVLASKCNVEEIIDNYLAEEAKQIDIILDSDASKEEFHCLMKKSIRDFWKSQQKLAVNGL